MIVGISGFIGCGKDTVANQLKKEFNFQRDSFATSLKDACAKLFDWERHMLEGDTAESRDWRNEIDTWWAENLGIPDFTPRLALQLIGTNALRNNFNPDIWLLSFANRVRKNPDQNFVISDARFFNELDFIKKQGGILIRVERGTDPEWYETASKANNGDADALEVMKTKYSYAHQSEWGWAGTKYDYVIDNNGTIEDLEVRVRKVISEII